VLDNPAKFGLLELVSTKIAQEWFGAAFPAMCDDGYGNCGCDRDSMHKMLAAYDVIDPDDVPHAGVSDAQVFDLLEFSYEKIALPLQGNWHDYMRHYHYDYDQEKGRAEFQAEVNRIFERRGVAYELRGGEVTRLAAATFHEALSAAAFRTGDQELDEMLEDARLTNSYTEMPRCAVNR
jgi:hypothetical protein